jgi:hypothetical protein
MYRQRVDCESPLKTAASGMLKSCVGAGIRPICSGFCDTVTVRKGQGGSSPEICGDQYGLTFRPLPNSAHVNSSAPRFRYAMPAIG